MKTLLITIALLIPTLAFAHTDCKIVQYEDHNEAVCIGDEKPIPEAAQRPAAALARETAAAPAKQQTFSADPETRMQAAIPADSSAQPSGQRHRQGRANQADQAGLRDAIAARRELIMQHMKPMQSTNTPTTAE